MDGTATGRIRSLAASLALLPMIPALVLIVIGGNLAEVRTGRGTGHRALPDPHAFDLGHHLRVHVARGRNRLWRRPRRHRRVGTIAILAALALGALPGTRREGEVHAVRCDVAAWQCGDAQLQEILGKHAEGRRLVSTRSQRFGEALSLTYHVTLRNEVGVDVLVRDLAEVEGVERVEALGVADAAG